MKGKEKKEKEKKRKKRLFQPERKKAVILRESERERERASPCMDGSRLMVTLSFVALRRISRCREALCHAPLEDGLVTEHKLPEALNHADSLTAKLLHRLGDEVLVVFPQPAGLRISIFKTRSGDLAGLELQRRDRLAAGLLGSLPFEHVQNRVDGAEGTGAPATSAAVHQDRPSDGRERLAVLPKCR